MTVCSSVVTTSGTAAAAAAIAASSTGLIDGTWSTPAETPSRPSSSAAASVRAVCWPVETSSDVRPLAQQDAPAQARTRSPASNTSGPPSRPRRR